MYHYIFSVNDDDAYKYHIRVYDLPKTILEFKKTNDLMLIPDFQRDPDAWSLSQQIAYCEFVIKGGMSPPFFFNCPEYKNGSNYDMVLVDGLQRITALGKMIVNEVPVFGRNIDDFPDWKDVLKRRILDFRINNLKTRKEVLQWYLQINSGGTVHTEEELERVRKLLKRCS